MKIRYKLTQVKIAVTLVMVIFGFIAHAEQFSTETIETDPNINTTHISSENPLSESLHIIGKLYTASNYTSRGPLHDSFSILFSPEFDNALNAEDAAKPMNFTENLGIGTPESAYSIERRELPFENEDLALFITNFNQQDYAIVFDVSQFDGTTPYIVDSFTGQETILEPGQTVYQFSVDPNTSGSADSDRFHIHFGPESLSTSPINDNLCGATLLTVGTECTGNPYSTTGATAQTGEPSGNCWFNDAAVTNSVWFTFVAPPSGSVKVTTDFVGSTLTDTELAIYEAPTICSDPSTLGTEVACDEDSGAGRLAVASATGLTPGNTYYIQVNGYNGSTGNFCIEVQNDGFVYENGSWSPQNPNGIATPSDDIYIANGTAIFDQNIDINTITVNSGATLEVDKVLTINGDIINNGSIIFKSTANSDGELAAVPNGSTIIGDFTTESYMSDHRSYRFVSSPVTTTSSIHANWQEGAMSATDDPNPGFGTHITGTLNDQDNGFDKTGSGNPSLFTLNFDSPQGFDAVENTDVNTIAVGDAYLLFVRGDRSINLNSNASHSSTVLRTTGTLFFGNKTQNFGSVDAGKFITVANPYQSAVALNNVLANSSANLNDGFAYVYDPSLSGGFGGYATVVLPSGTNGSSSTANAYLQPGQAVQVEVETTGPTSLSFSEIDKAPGIHSTTFSNENPFEDNLHINAQLFTATNYASGKTPHDAFNLLFNENFDNALNQDDATKPMNMTENMGIETPENPFSIERRALPVENEDISLFNTNYNHQNYTLVLEVSAFAETMPYFVDSYTGEDTELQTGENVINFSVDQSIPESTVFNRFHIHFGPSTLSVDVTKTDYGIKLYPNPAQSGAAFYVSAGQYEGQNVNVSITDILGKTVYSAKKQFNAGQVAIQTNAPLDSGVYFVQIAQGGKTVNKRLIVK